MSVGQEELKTTCIQLAKSKKAMEEAFPNIPDLYNPFYYQNFKYFLHSVYLPFFSLLLPSLF